MSILLESDSWIADSVSPAISSDTRVVTDVVALRRLLADEPHHDLVVFGPDVEMSVVADFTAGERIGRPALGVVLLRRRLDTAILKDAMRAGVREVVKLDDLVGLTQACRDSVAVSCQVRGEVGLAAGRPESSLGRLVTVFSAKGGCGKTTVATNMAASLAKQGRRVCLLDLDLAFGDVAITLQLFPDRGVADLAGLPGGIDRKAVTSIVTAHSARLDAVLAPVEPGAAEGISAEMVRELVQQLKSLYDVVVVDTPPAFTDQVLTAFDASDHIVLVTTLDIPAIKNLKLTLETLDLLGYSRERWRVVLNRADSKVGLAVDDVQKTLSMPIAAMLPSSRDVPASINRGVAIVQDAPGHAVSTAMRKFTAALLADVPAGGALPVPDARRRGIGLRRRAKQATA